MALNKESETKTFSSVDGTQNNFTVFPAKR